MRAHTLNPPRNDARVNAAGWRFRCPRNHSNITWAGPRRIYCPECVDGYTAGEIEDRRTGGTLDELLGE